MGEPRQDTDTLEVADVVATVDAVRLVLAYLPPHLRAAVEDAISALITLLAQRNHARQEAAWWRVEAARLAEVAAKQEAIADGCVKTCHDLATKFQPAVTELWRRWATPAAN